MLFIFETELPLNKPIYIALQHVFGIGKQTSKTLCHRLGFSINLKTKDLTQQHAQQLTQIADDLQLTITSDLKKKISLNNSKQIAIKSYRGLRKIYKLPSRGQRTHTNAKTARKKRYLII